MTKSADAHSRNISDGLRLLIDYTKEVFADADLVGVRVVESFNNIEVVIALESLGWRYGEGWYFKDCWLYWLV